MRLEEMTTAEHFIKAYPDMKNMPLAKDADRIILSYCLDGRYQGIQLVKDKDIVGYVFFYIEDFICKIVGASCKNHFKEFQGLLYAHAEKLGCKALRTITSAETKSYERLTGMKKVYSIYEKKLGES